MIIDDKVIMLPPPPPYLSSSSTNTSAGLSSYTGLSSSGRPTLTTLPPHILLQIIYNTFPSDSLLWRSQDSKPLLQRRVLFWLSTSLRLVSRQLYTACMNVLRSTYLQSYQSLIRPPYTTDPFPLTESHSAGPGSNPPSYSSSSTSRSIPPSSRTAVTTIKSTQRETPILDLYIALKVRQDVFSDDSELHIEREDAYRDLFDISQPKARLEDLVREYGVREGVVSVPGYTREMYYKDLRTQDVESKNSSKSSLVGASSPTTPTGSGTKHSKSTSSASRWFSSLKRKSSCPLSTSSAPPSSPSLPSPNPTQPSYSPLPFSSLTISFSPRKIGLIYNRSRTIAEVPRAATPAQRREQTLEGLARVLVREVRVWLEDC